MVFCSIDVGVGGKVPFVVACYRAVLKHECHERTKGTGNTKGTKDTKGANFRDTRPFVFFVIRKLRPT
jgi:hypothetical protein